MLVAATSTLATSIHIPSIEVHRPSANFHPSVWGDRFIQYASEISMELDDKLEEQIKVLKEEVRKMLITTTTTNKPMETIYLIDLIQRLGVNYHFEREIDNLLQEIHNTYVENGIITLEEEDLHSLALLFRLLRQEGYRISPDVFNKFKDKEGKFEKRVRSDVKGMLSLYEAAHMRVHGEEILDEAMAFTSNHLKIMLTHQLCEACVVAQINHSLRHPLRKVLPRLEARHYISVYQHDSSHNQTLLMFAKLDFNMLQKLHQREVANMTKWWLEDLDVPRKLPFARDRIVEGCFWIVGVYFEPHYALARKIMTKIIALSSIIDDIYDAYGTIEELELFTLAMERWNICCLDFLPEYMKVCYKEVLDVYKEIEQELKKEGMPYAIDYAKNKIIQLAQAYLVEARWLNSNHTPTCEEYMAIATMSCGFSMLTTTSLIGMGPTATEDVFNWSTTQPQIIKASSVVCRLMDDIVSNEFEQKRGHVASILECYMKQHGVSRDEAIDELRKVIDNAWKDINEECLNPTKVAMPFLIRVVNLARCMDVLYKHESSYTHSGGIMKKYIEALLVDPIPI